MSNNVHFSNVCADCVHQKVCGKKEVFNKIKDHFSKENYLPEDICNEDGINIQVSCEYFRKEAPAYRCGFVNSVE